MTLCEIVVKRTVANQGAINKSGMLSICLLIPGKAIATTLTTIKTRSFEYSLLAAPGVYLSHQRMVLWGIPASGHRQIYQAQKSASEDQSKQTIACQSDLGVPTLARTDEPSSGASWSE